MKKTLLVGLIFAVMLVIGTFVAALFLKTAPVENKCGDGVCDKEELDICMGDCGVMCTQYSRTGGIGSDNCFGGWKDLYTLELQKNEIPEEFFKETLVFDYNSDVIQKALEDVGYTTSPYDAVKKVGAWTINNVDYNSNVVYKDCFNKKASKVINESRGVCSTQSKVDIALLRALGIAAKPMTGCLKISNSCKILAAFNVSVTDVKYSEEMVVDDEGYAVSMGALHTWVEAWLPDLGWVILEPTTGMITEQRCIDYMIYYDNVQENELCGLKTSNPYVDMCKNY